MIWEMFGNVVERNQLLYGYRKGEMESVLVNLNVYIEKVIEC